MISVIQNFICNIHDDNLCGWGTPDMEERYNIIWDEYLNDCIFGSSTTCDKDYFLNLESRLDEILCDINGGILEDNICRHKRLCTNSVTNLA